MLTIPWFVTKTFQDLFRRTPVPIENQQQQQFQQNVLQHEQLQHYQQQSPPHVRQTQVQQNQAPERQPQVQQQQQAAVKQPQVQQQASVKQPQVQRQQQAAVRQPQVQQQAPVKQPQVQQQAPVKQPQVQQEQAPVKQQVPQQEAPVKQHVQQQQAPVKQVQQQQAPVSQQVQQQQAPVKQQVHQQQASANQVHDQQHQIQRQETTASSSAHTAHVHKDLSQQNATRVQNVTPPKSPASEVSTDFIQAKTESQQHTSPGVRELHSSATSQLSEATPNTPTRPAADLSLQTSTRRVVLQNSGGRMSFEWAQKQVEKFQFDFDQADTDKSGSLSFQEVYNVLKNVGFKGSKEEAESIFRHLDRDQDKKITREEFKATLSNLPRLSIKEFVLRKAFLKLDKDGSGFLTKSEIIDATKSDAGLDIAAEKISDLLLYLIQEDTDEKVSYEEFLHVFGVESAATVMRQVFAKLDTDGSGFLTKEEVLEAVKAENELKLKADKISDLLIYWCKDKDKQISYNEFVDVWLQQKKEKPKK